MDALQTTALVADPYQKPTWTTRRETDAHTALTRGVAEYLATLVSVDFSGREFRLKRAFDTWAESEDLAQYPSAIAYGPELAQYDSSMFTPSTTEFITKDGYALRTGAEYVMPVYVDIYCTDKDERVGVVAMVEDAFLPVDFMYGARLALPHYFGQHAAFALQSCLYVDSEAAARQNVRVAQLVLSASVPFTRAVKLPTAKTSVRFDMVDDLENPKPPVGAVLVQGKM